MSDSLYAIELGPSQFDEIRELTYRIAGIDLRDGKQSLVQSRLTRRLRRLGLPDFGSYLTHLRQDSSGVELAEMIDALTTNKTSFFRESRHFEFLTEHVLRPAAAERRQLRFWSAGCSTGEEPYSLALSVLAVNAPAAVRSEVRILATDISAEVLAKARKAVYDERQVADVPPHVLRSGFRQVSRQPAQWQVDDEARALVRFARLNLMGDWPMRGPFDAILCRNVMIYFDKPTQERLVQRFSDLLAPGGYLIVGHSESLTGVRHRLRYVRPAVYVR